MKAQKAKLKRSKNKRSSIKRPLIMAHAGGKGHGRENSVLAIQNSNKYKPDFIELDLRRSKDGVIFCFHGSFPLGMMMGKSTKMLPFNVIKKMLGVNTLDELLKAIKGRPSLYLDLKHKTIKAHELEAILKKYSFNEVWIATYSIMYLKQLRKELGEKYKYIYNLGKLNVNQLLKNAEHFDGVQLFFWQCNDDIIKKIKKLGLEHSVNTMFTPRRVYERLSLKHKTRWICYDRLDNRNKKDNKK